MRPNLAMTVALALAAFAAPGAVSRPAAAEQAVVRKDKFEQLTDEQKKVLVETGIRAHVALNKSIRRDDDKSYQTVLKRGISEVDTTENQAEWEDAGKEVRERLAGRVYPKSLLDAVIAAAGSEE